MNLLGNEHLARLVNGQRLDGVAFHVSGAVTRAWSFGGIHLNVLGEVGMSRTMIMLGHLQTELLTCRRAVTMLLEPIVKLLTVRG